MPRRIELAHAEDDAEAAAGHIFAKLQAGEITVSDLMGPLFGTPNLTPALVIPRGDKAPGNAAPNAEFLPATSVHNQELVEHVHPHDYVNPTPEAGYEYDLVVIGAGVSGLLSVIVGAWLGKSCALIERHGMGGDCLNTGCVPSKALIACARAAHSVHELKNFGVHIPEGPVTVDFGFVMERMRAIRAKISHHDSVQRYKRDFCKDVYVGHAEFVGGNEVTVKADDGSTRTLRFKKAMVATGASASIPPVEGLAQVPHLTNSNFFNLTEQPPRMVVIGCGPIGLELSQAMRRFGTQVTCLEMGPRLLPREDPDAADVLKKQLDADGVNILLGVKLLKVECVGDNAGGQTRTSAPWALYRVHVQLPGQSEVVVIEGEALLNATGRSPNVHDVGLDKVGVDWDNRQGVHINEFFATANPDIYACGDCATAYKFTHSADFQARLAVRNMFLGDTHRLSDLLIPWCTYTEPEVAHVGKYEAELSAAGVEFETFTRQLADVDRCICDGVTSGFVKITVKAGTDEIVGATICGPNAGDMITELTLCMQHGIGIAHIAGTIHPYPTTQEAVRQACLGYNKYFKDPTALPLRTLRLAMADKEARDKTK